MCTTTPAHAHTGSHAHARTRAPTYHKTCTYYRGDADAGKIYTKTIKDAYTHTHTRERIYKQHVHPQTRTCTQMLEHAHTCTPTATHFNTRTYAATCNP